MSCRTHTYRCKKTIVLGGGGDKKHTVGFLVPTAIAPFISREEFGFYWSGVTIQSLIVGNLHFPDAHSPEASASQVRWSSFFCGEGG